MSWFGKNDDEDDLKKKSKDKKEKVEQETEEEEDSEETETEEEEGGNTLSFSFDGADSFTVEQLTTEQLKKLKAECVKAMNSATPGTIDLNDYGYNTIVNATRIVYIDFETEDD